MSDTPQGGGWWQASDDRWYPPETHPDHVAPPPPDPGHDDAVPEVTALRSRRMTLAIVAAIVVVAAAGVAVALVAVGGDDGDTTVDAVVSAIDDGSPDGTSSRDSPRGTPGPFAEGCAYLGVDAFGDMQVEISFINPFDTTGDLVVSVGVVAPDGIRIATSDEFVDAAKPDERFRIHHDTLTDLPRGLDADAALTCEMLTVEELVFGSPGATPGPGSGCVFVRVDPFDDIQIELTVTNPFDTTTDVAARYALRGADDVRFATGFTIVDALEPGETSRSAHDTFTEFPEWTSSADFTCEVLELEDFGF